MGLSFHGHGRPGYVLAQGRASHLGNGENSVPLVRFCSFTRVTFPLADVTAFSLFYSLER